MGIGTIKDSRGNEHLVFEKDSSPISSFISSSENSSSIGNKLEDFQILQVLGKGGFGFVAKARSLLNGKIYALKQIDFNKLTDPKARELAENEMVSLKQLDHPNINKYYHHFRINNFLYLVMEFMNNGDIEGYIKMRKELNMPIEEETLWNIFIQSMEGLAYIHQKKIIHRDIKPANLFMTNHGIIKIGDLGVSAFTNEDITGVLYSNNANSYHKSNSDNNSRGIIYNEDINMDIENNFDPTSEEYIKHLSSGTIVGTPINMAPEMLGGNLYDQKVDVYSMGVTFYQMCYFLPPKSFTKTIDGSMRFYDVEKKYNINIYSKELTDIIDLMLKRNPNERKTAKEILDILKIRYNQKYYKNTGIDSVIKCMSSFSRLTDYLKRPRQMQALSNCREEKPICYNYCNCLQIIQNYAFAQLSLYVSDIRQRLIDQDSKLNGSEEIEPKIVINFLLDKFHQELNRAIKIIDDSGSPYLSNFIPSKIGDYQQNPADKQAMLMNFIKFFRQNYRSAISDFFFGVMKTKKICQNCFTPIYSFNSYNLINFDLNTVVRQNPNYKYFSIFDLFCIQNGNFVELGTDKYVQCNNCKSVQRHNEFKQFYSTPYNIIINFERGPDCQNKVPIVFQEYLDFNEQTEVKMEKSYQLIGIIKRCERQGKVHYISMCYNNGNGKWLMTDGRKIDNIDSPMNHNEGDVVTLFYQLLL